jgi:hypothetical protein
LPHPITCASGFSRPLDAFIRPEPAGLVSCQIRSWGFALQSLTPPAQPYAVSGAVALLSLKRPSCRLALPTSTRKRAFIGHVFDLPNAPRLQGFAPRESPPLRPGCLDRNQRVALLGFVPSRVFPLSSLDRTFTRSPLTSFCFARPQATSHISSPGSRKLKRLACLFRDRRPSWASSPLDLPRAFGRVAVRESPPRVPGFVTVPSSDSL